MNNEPHILIVDDHRDIRDAVQTYLQNPLAKELLSGAIPDGAQVRIAPRSGDGEGEFTFETIGEFVAADAGE